MAFFPTIISDQGELGITVKTPFVQMSVDRRNYSYKWGFLGFSELRAMTSWWIIWRGIETIMFKKLKRFNGTEYSGWTKSKHRSPRIRSAELETDQQSLLTQKTLVHYGRTFRYGRPFGILGFKIMIFSLHGIRKSFIMRKESEARDGGSRDTYGLV